MARGIQVFTNNDLGQVRIIGNKENPLFCLRDVCDVLEIKNNTDVKSSIIKEFGDDLDLIYPLKTAGGLQKATFITEPQLYFILMRSDKPKAKPFRQWVISEVLPTIRKTGSYTTKQNNTVNMKPATYTQKLKTAKILKEYSDLYRNKYNGRYSQILDSYAIKELTGQELLPLPEMIDKYYTAQEAGSMLGISANMIGRLANINNLKTDMYGKLFFDKSKYSNKEVETFRYNKLGIDKLETLL